MSNGTAPQSPTSPVSDTPGTNSVPPIITGDTLIGWEPGLSSPPPPAPPLPPPPAPIYKSSNTSAMFHSSGNTAPPHVPPPKWIGVEIGIKLFRLSIKFLPIAVVLAGGFYSYSYFFGSVPIVESTLVALGAEPSSEPKTPSKAAQLIQQTRDVVAASDRRVLFANSLAEDPVTALPPSENPIPTEFTPPTSSSPNHPPPAASHVTILDRLAMFEAERADTSISSAPPRHQPDNIEPIISPVEPSVNFRRWVAELEVKGLRRGELNRVFINDLAIDIGDIVNHRLGIIFAGLGEADTVLVFKDATGALVTKSY